ncbi:hypothetical protein [Magnetospirillum molischianum]|uniref:Large polyvalent protein associated domain-containing protein n=1 Tax=Magnetospirillum molischianum DSM 120 TaxID=1150626 RepID=H8FP78_MAGML|nr:hypothetical protein [Magnetospirillum molischianum]CCG40166.1 membrane hypothetical protein [Magnetospirillum molischianum DSM 120]
MSDFASFMDGSPDAKTEDPNSFGSFMASVESDRSARLGSNLIAAADTNPDAHAKAMEIGRQIGAPADAIAANLGEGERMAKLQKMREALGSAPKLAEFLTSDPDMAKLSSDDFSALTRLEGSMTAAASFGRGVDLLQSMLYGAAEWSGEATGSKDLATWARRGRQANEAEAAAHGTRSQFLNIGGVGDAAQWGKETLFEQLPLMSPALAGSLAGAGIGGAVGGPPGAVAGGLIGGFAPSVVMGIGETQGQLKQKDPNAEAPVSVAVGGIAIGLLDSIVPGLIGRRLVTVLGKEAAEKVTHEGIAAAAGALLKGAGIEGATEAAQEAIGEFAAAHGADQAVDWQGLGPQMVEAAAAGFLMGGAFEGGAKGIEKLAERQKVAEAKKTAAALTDAVAATQESKLATRDPERFADLVRQIAGDGQLHIPAESLQSLYQSGVIDDATLDGLDVTAQLPEALAAGGDVLVDPAKYLSAASKLTPEALAQMIGSTRRGATDMTMKEVEAFLADPARRKDATDLIESLSIQYEGAKPGQIVEDEVTQALMKTGHYTESQAKAQAVLWRERMIQRGADRGMDPDALWLEEKPRILGPAPRLPVDDIDLVLERIRSGNEVKPPRQPVLDIFRHLGGVKPGSMLAQELAAMGITPKEAPGLFRPTGIGSADQVVVSEHEVLRDNQVKADNSGNGYADHDALMQAVAREWAGDPLQTQAYRDRAARLDAPVRDLRKALEAEGIIPELATKENVLRLMERDQSADALGQEAGRVISALQEIVAGADEATVSDLRPDLVSLGGASDVSFVWGNSKRGLEHIGRKRGASVVLQVIRAVALGKITKQVEGKKTVHLELDGTEAVLSLDLNGDRKTWLLTGWEIGKPDARGEVGAQSKATQNAPTFSRDDLGAGLQAIISRGDPLFQPNGGGLRGSFDPIDDTIRLFETANLSTFLHEGGHLWLFQMVRDLGDERLRPEARDRTVRDLQTVMDWMNVEIDVATASPGDIQAAIPVEAHEKWARGIEAYLMEGKAPSVALRDVFQRFSAWLIRTYKKVRNLSVKLTPEIRGVMDRLLASDEAIEQARRDSVFRVPSELLAVLALAERREIEQAQEQAALEAKAELQGRAMRELARERLAWWKTEREGVRAEVEADVRTRPAYRVVALSKGIGPDGAKLIDPDTGEAQVLKLDRKALVAEYGEEIVRLLPTGVTVAKGGVNHHIVAGWFGLPHGDALRLALMDAKANPQAEVIERETDARMRERHGDMVTDGRIAEDAADIVATGKAIEAVALQAKCLKRLVGDTIDKAAARRQAEQGAGSRSDDQARIDAAATSTDQVINAGVPAEGTTAAQVAEAMAAGEAKAAPLQRTAQRAAVRQVRNILAGMDHTAIREAAAKFIAARQVSQATDATMYRAQAKRHEKRATLALAARDYVEAHDAKQQQLLNMELERLAREARTEVEKFQAKARRLNKPDGKLAATMDEDFFRAARQVLARYGLARANSDFDTKVWLDRLEETDPAGAEDIAAIIANLTKAPTPGQVKSRIMPDGRRVEIAPDYRDMTMAAFRDLRDGVQALLTMGRNARSALVDGERVEFERITEEARAQLEPFQRDRDLSHMPTDTEKNRHGLLGIVASWRIAESWARLADLGKVGVMTKYVIRPVFDAVHAYRTARREIQEKLLAILSPVRDDLAKPQLIQAPELKDGFYFSNKGQLIHAILHTGNESNMKKLLVGWKWATLNKDGSFDRSGWASFMSRMFADGVVTKADMDMVQSVWDLLESTKPAAQAAHKAMYGVGFKEIEASPIKTPFGEYRGGYVPALTEKSLNVDGAGQEAVEALTAQQSGAMFPAAARGFTENRVENYAEPLTLDLLLLPAHLNKVLLFSHVGPAVRQTARLLKRRDFREVVGRYDPSAIDGVLWPMLERAVRQTVETPALTPGGRKAAEFARYFRTTAGLQAMCGNLLNAAQQITGISSAATMVGGGALARSLVTVWRNPESSTAAIMAKSALMRERMDSSAYEASMEIEKILKDHTLLGKGQSFAQRHGYFAQQLAQNFVDRVVWWAAYDKEIGNGTAEAEAVQQADSAVRLTQGSFSPESVAAVEAGNAWVRLFTQFMTYFMAQGNMIATEVMIALRTMTGGNLSRRLAGVYVFAFLIPAVVAEAIMQAGRGELGDEDDDGWLDDLASLFLLPQLRFFAAMIPVAGPVAMLGINALNDKPYDDRLAASPAVTLMESAGRAAVTTAKAVAGDGDKSRAVSDAMNAVSVATGIPTGMIRKPASYAVDVAEGDSRPRHLGNVVSGILTGQDGTAR